MIIITRRVVDILMIAAASRLLQSAELFENGLTLYIGELFSNGYIEIEWRCLLQNMKSKKL